MWFLVKGTKNGVVIFTSPVSNLIVVASIQCLRSLQKTIWTLFSLIWSSAVHGLDWNNADWSPLMVESCVFRILSAKFISTSVNFSPIMVASSLNFFIRFFGREQATSSTTMLLCTLHSTTADDVEAVIWFFLITYWYNMSLIIIGRHW